MVSMTCLRVPHTIKYKVDTATKETILDLRLKRFGSNRIRFRLKRLGVYLSSKNDLQDIEKSLS